MTCQGRKRYLSSAANLEKLRPTIIASPVITVELWACEDILCGHWTVATVMAEPEQLEFILRSLAACTRAAAATLVAAALMSMVAAMMFVAAALVVLIIS